MNDPTIEIRAFRADDSAPVLTLFTRINRALAPAPQASTFERYIEGSIDTEMGKISEYYASERGAGFWVAVQDRQLAGFFGIEPSDPGAAELRRMYVAPEYRRCGLGRRLLAEAEANARAMGYRRLDLSTSELQGAALALYRCAGYEEIGEAIAENPSNKTVGGGIRRHHFAKQLGRQPGSWDQETRE
jgi:putative acetyltransferase